MASAVFASGGEKPRKIDYPEYPPAPARQSPEGAEKASIDCISCHTDTDAKTMHVNPGVQIGCADCHGGNPTVQVGAVVFPDSKLFEQTKADAHVQPTLPDSWGETSGAPERSYTLLNRESPEYVRFVNPGDLRVAAEACGACHMDLVKAAKSSLMATTAMLWGGASYNNGILPFKRYILGEAYTREGEPAAIQAPENFVMTPELQKSSVLPGLVPLPVWETVPPADNFRIFERGGRFVRSQFPEIGQPNSLEEPGKPDVRQSNRGPGTGTRISVPVLNIHKTRLNDPTTWFDGTMDNPGDFRSSGCSSCHVVYANDRDPLHSGPYAKYGHWGQTITSDPTIKDLKGEDGEPEKGHPLKHQFTSAIPTSQCMICHMHQPNMFLNSYLGYTMWDYESDAPLMWPEQQANPSPEEIRQVNDRNPEEAAIRGKWADLDFLSRVWDDVNPQAKDTQFADYHGHGWNFRAVFKRDRDGTLLDAKGAPVADDLPPAEKWKRAVHMRDIHADAGMQCTDCHFAQDNHGNGFLHGEVAAEVEIRCRDCHGTTSAKASLRTSGPAAPSGGNDLSGLLNMDGRPRFVWRAGKLYQRLVLPPHEERPVVQVRDSVTPIWVATHGSVRAKTMAKGQSMNWGSKIPKQQRAHDENMACFTCHSSWVTSCGGCHLTIQANWKSEGHHYEGGESRNFATYNPQVARDQMFQLGVHGEVKDGIIAPVRSSSALVFSSVDGNRNKIYIQQQPVSAGGYSAQAFAPHFPHTVRKTETKTCTDCHISDANDNNAIMAQLLLLGTNFVNFLGFNAWVGTEHAIQAVQVTEWDEPQAVIGSYLHRYAYPDWFENHVGNKMRLDDPSVGNMDGDPDWVKSVRGFLSRSIPGIDLYDGNYGHHSGEARCVQLRGEYLYVAEGKKGMQAFDVANIGNKAFSERIVSAPWSPLGQNVRIKSKDATCVALPTTQMLRPERNRTSIETRPEDLEQPMHAIYSYAAVTDSEEGLILVNVETLGDFEPRNNYFQRAVTWNPEGALDGATYAHFSGHILYVSASQGIAVVDLDDPLSPKLLSMIPLNQPRASMQQFRYLFAVDADGLKVIDVTRPEQPRIVPGASVPLAEANRVSVARTYAYVAAGSEGLAIIDIEKPESPKLLTKFPANGKLNDAHDGTIATTNASLFAYVADGRNGLKVLQLTSPDLNP
ncbi:MAG TPA: hypothetical protein EYQ31_05965, partial [Candidatus Handelsmanbacteria bacterium]|nr:hypothetical protein [Candidatus Handelsmanbacteria bacterium]